MNFAEPSAPEEPEDSSTIIDDTSVNDSSVIDPSYPDDPSLGPEDPSLGPSPEDPSTGPSPDDPSVGPDDPSSGQEDEENQAYSVLNAELTGNDGDEVTLLNNN